MSGNNILPFFAAEYENRRVSIRRTADYDDMINCVRRAFPSLAEVPANQISISQVFPELGEGAVEISRDSWKEALAWVKTTQVVVSELAPETVSKKRKTVTLQTETGPVTPNSIYAVSTSTTPNPTASAPNPVASTPPATGMARRLDPRRPPAARSSIRLAVTSKTPPPETLPLNKILSIPERMPDSDWMYYASL